MESVLRVERAVEPWKALVSGVERLGAAHSMQAVIAIVKDTAREISGADGVTFVLREGDLCHYVAENAVAPLWLGRRFPLTACISGWCMIHNQMAVIPDIYADARIPHDAYRPTFVKSLVMTPVGAGEPVAAIGAYWAVERDFEDGEIALLHALGRSTAAAIAAIRARDRSHENEARLALALYAGGMGAWEINIATGDLTASSLFRESSGQAASKPLSQADMINAIHREDRNRFQAALGSAILLGSEIDVQLRAVPVSGETRLVELRGRVATDEDGEPVRIAGVSLDITEREKAKKRLECLSADLAHMGRLNELGQMVSALAHELSQPLAAAQNYLGAARRFENARGADERVAGAIEKADGQITRSKEIIQRVREFVRRGQRMTANLPLLPLVEEAAQLATLDSKGRGVSLEISIDRGLRVEADKVQIQQVLVNLIRNALEAMEHSPSRQIRIAAAMAGDSIEVSVADTGPGIAPEIAERLFEPFTTTKADGMGVGLSLCRGIVERHGGHIQHQAGEKGGAMFYFTLPAAKT